MWRGQSKYVVLIDWVKKKLAQNMCQTCTTEPLSKKLSAYELPKYTNAISMETNEVHSIPI